MSDDEAVPSFDDATKEAAYWRVKAHDLQDMLREAEESLREFADSSKELEQEMERELAQSNKQLQESRARNEKLSQDKDEWKSKYQASLVEHNKTLAEMSRELDSLRESHNIYKSKLRDMELDNDELENAERMVRSSLADIETRYNAQMEKTVLMEQEIIDKDKLQEEVQRLRDELREVNEEVAVLKERGETAATSRNSTPVETATTAATASVRRTPLLPRASLSHARKPSRPTINDTDSPRTAARRTMTATPSSTSLAASTTSRVTPARRTTAGAGGGTASVRMMKDLTANMAALRSRINTACAFGATPESDAITAAAAESAANTSAIPRPASRLGASGSSPLGSSTSTVLGRSTGAPRPSFDGRTSIPVASSSTLSRSIKRPTSRLSMGVRSGGGPHPEDDDDEGDSPNTHPHRSMTPTMYTARARAMGGDNSTHLHAGPRSTTLSRSSTSTPLDFLNSEPPPFAHHRPTSRTAFTPKDSIITTRERDGDTTLASTSTARRRGSVSAGSTHVRHGSVTNPSEAISSRLPSVATQNRPRGSTLSGGGGGVGRTTRPSSSSGATHSHSHSRSGSTSESVQAFREARLARAQAAQQRPSSRLALSSTDDNDNDDQDDDEQENFRLSSSNAASRKDQGPPPVSWKSRSRVGVVRSGGGVDAG